MATITIAGLGLAAQLQAAGQPLVIDKFIYADVPDLDPAIEPPGTEVLPDPATIVNETAVTRAGYVGTDTVIYSSVLSSAVGDFWFNWIGLYCSEHNTLVAVSYVPRQEKRKTAQFVMGNTLTKNFALQFLNATDLTGVVINAETWQIDLFARLAGIDERERRSNFDIYGTKYFFGDGFKLVKNGAAYELQPGIGYVDGIRLVLDAAQALGDAGALPTNVYLDAALAGDYTGVNAVWTPQISDAELIHYVDEANQSHYLELIAVINADGSVTDRRDDGIGGTIRGVDAAMAAHLAANNPHPQYMTADDAAIITKVCQGRLTLASGNATPTNDITGATTLYWTPHLGNMLTLYNGSRWAVYTFAERSLSSVGLPGSTLFDIFLHDDDGVLTLSTAAWASDSARATALVTLDGIKVSGADNRKRYLGTIMTTADSKFEDSKINRLVWNQYNQVPKTVKAENSTGSWTYSSPVWREYNNGVGMVRGNFVLGDASGIDLSLSAVLISTAVNTCYAVIRIDSDTTNPSCGYVFSNAGMLGNIFYEKAAKLSAGKHYLTQFEYASASMITVYGFGYPGLATISM